MTDRIYALFTSVLQYTLQLNWWTFFVISSGIDKIASFSLIDIREKANSSKTAALGNLVRLYATTQNQIYHQTLEECCKYGFFSSHVSIFDSAAEICCQMQCPYSLHAVIASRGVRGGRFMEMSIIL